jgi:hypothetical protein
MHPFVGAKTPVKIGGQLPERVLLHDLGYIQDLVRQSEPFHVLDRVHEVAFRARLIVRIAEVQQSAHPDERLASIHLQVLPDLDGLKGEVGHEILGVHGPEHADQVIRAARLIEEVKPFQQQDGLSGLCAVVGGRQSDWAASDHNNVILVAH